MIPIKNIQFSYTVVTEGPATYRIWFTLRLNPSGNYVGIILGILMGQELFLNFDAISSIIGIK